MKPLILNLTPTGMIPTKAMSAHVPVSPAEIVADVSTCVPHGVSIVHLHARDEKGLPTFRREVFAEIIEGIRSSHPELVLVVSTSGRTYSEFEQRSDVLRLKGGLKPDMASLTLGSLNFNKVASINSPDMIMRLAETMQEEGIKPELEVFDLGMVNNAHYLIRKGLITPPYYFNFILGNIASAQARLLHLGLLTSELPPESFWSVGGVGGFQLSMNTVGIACGDGVRVGLEDNLFLDEERKVLATNLSLVERVERVVAALGRPLATAPEVRRWLKLG